MDPLSPVRKLDSHQQKSKWLAIPFAVIKKFGDDQAGNLAALMAYYAFFSLFPLLLVFVTILGFVLQGDPSAQKSVENSVLGQLPIIKDQINLHSLNGSAVPLVIGLLTSLWAGLGITNAAQNAFDRVWAVPFKHRASFVHARLRGIALLVSLGAMFIISSLASGLVTGGLGGPVLKVAGIVLSLALNVCLFLASFRLLTGSTVETRELWPGVVVAAVLWEILQIVQGIYIGHILKNSGSTYGTFGFVIALLIWLRLGAQIVLYSAEINVILARRLWPRSLFSPSVPADERTLAALAKVEERDDREKIAVTFEDSDEDEPAPEPTKPAPGAQAPQRTSEEPVGRLAPRQLERPRAQPALRRAAGAHLAARLVGHLELATQDAAGERLEASLELGRVGARRTEPRPSRQGPRGTHAQPRPRRRRRAVRPARRRGAGSRTAHRRSRAGRPPRAGRSCSRRPAFALRPRAPARPSRRRSGPGARAETRTAPRAGRPARLPVARTAGWPGTARSTRRPPRPRPAAAASRRP